MQTTHPPLGILAEAADLSMACCHTWRARYRRTLVELVSRYRGVVVQGTSQVETDASQMCRCPKRTHKVLQGKVHSSESLRTMRSSS